LILQFNKKKMIIIIIIFIKIIIFPLHIYKRDMEYKKSNSSSTIIILGCSIIVLLIGILIGLLFIKKNRSRKRQEKVELNAIDEFRNGSIKVYFKNGDNGDDNAISDEINNNNVNNNNVYNNNVNNNNNLEEIIYSTSDEPPPEYTENTELIEIVNSMEKH